MWETDDDLRRLQAVLDRSLAEARSPMLHHIFTPERALTAAQVVELFTDRQVAALGTTSPTGEPRVAPVDVFLVRGDFQLSTRKSAARYRHLMRNPATSLAYYVGDDVAVIAHGDAQLFDESSDDFEDADRACVEIYESSATSWGTDPAAYIRIRPHTMFAMRR